MRSTASTLAKAGAVFSLIFGLTACSSLTPQNTPLTGTEKTSDTLHLTSLTVTGGEMVPATFTATNHDYAVYCAKTSGNVLTFNLGISEGVAATINGSETGSTSEVVMNADQLVKISLSRGKDSGTYWVRCLPPGFPVIKMERKSELPSGWYVTAAIGEVDGVARSYGVILNDYGTPVWYRPGKDSFDPNGIPRGPMGLQVLSDGTLAWFETQGMPFGVSVNEGFQRFTVDGDEVATYRVSGGMATNHHELLQLPDGGFLINAVDLKQPKKPTECWIPTNQAGKFKRVYADLLGGAHIERLDASGKTIWSWDADYHGSLGKASDSRIDVSETTDPFCWPNGEKKYLKSGIHPNALDMQGNLIVMSARNANAIYGIDATTGKLVFKLGGTYRADISLKFEGDPSDLPHSQHDVRITKDGNITILNNRPQFPPFLSKWEAKGPAAFMEYKLDLKNRTASLVRSYSHPDNVKSGAMGSGRVLLNGGVLVGWGAPKSTIFATEYSPSGEILMNLRQDMPRYVYRVLKVDANRLDADKLRKAVEGIKAKS